jgi:hypothetical protein
MPYLPFIGRRVADSCVAPLLAHYDTAVDTNVAPYYLYVAAGGPAFSGYDISTTAQFGAGALDVVEGAATEMSVWLNDDFDPLGIPFDGKATFEWRMRRPGGLQGTGLGTSESSYFGLEMRLSDSDILYLTFGYYGSAFPAQDQGAGLRVFTENGAPASGFPRATGYGWTDSAYHAIRVTLTGGNTVLLHVDGEYKTSITISALPTSGVMVDSIAFWGGKTIPTTTDALQFDEVRVIIGRALSTTSDYTPATGAWLTADCDSDTVPPAAATLLLHFEDGDGATSIADSSAFARTLTGHDGCKVSTTRSKWGTGSLKCVRSSDAKGLQIPYTTDFANTSNQPFWFDFWVYHESQTAGGAALILTHIGGEDSGNIDMLQVIKHSPSNVIYTRTDTDIFGIDESFPYANPLTANTWHHVAYGFDGTNQMRFVDGVLAFSQARSVGANARQRLVIGGQPSGTNETADGTTTIYIDEYRFLLGECPHTSNFTPPTGPY